MEELASIDRDSEALKMREGNIPKAAVEVGDYQSDGLHLHKKKDCRAFAAVRTKKAK